MKQGRRATALIMIGLGVAACGGSAAESSATEEQATGTPSSPEASIAPASGAASPGSAAPADPDVGTLNTAVVTIGADRYEFSDVQCSIFAPRYIQAGNYGGDPEVQIVLPPEGWESQGDTYGPPSVQVTIGDESAGGVVWLAGDNGSPTIAPIKAGSSQLDSYTVPDGRPVKATGTATFIDLTAHRQGKDADVKSGTFAVSCP
jgi:hypothetical protein